MPLSKVKVQFSFKILTCLFFMTVFTITAYYNNVVSESWLQSNVFTDFSWNRHYDKLFLTEVEERPGQVWVRFNAKLKERLEFYNYIVSIVRNRVLSKITTHLVWPKQSKRIFSNEGNFLKDIAINANTTTTVYLQYQGPQLDRHWDSSTEIMHNNYIITQYYDWNGIWPLCKWLNQWRWKIYQQNSCVHNAQINNVSSIEINDKPVSINVYLILNQMIGSPLFPYIFFLHIIPHATVTVMGQVFGKDYEIVPTECTEDPDIAYQPPEFDPNNVYEEVFVITQYFGTDYYHKMMEDLPRLAQALPFLRQYPKIRIHMLGRDNHTDALFQALHLNPERIVTGVVHAILVYLPRSAPCGEMRIPEGQLLSHEYRKYIENNLAGDKNWNSVILIKRTIKRGRHFSQQIEIESAVRNLTTKYGLRYELFTDNPVPSPEQTMLMFYRARVIIAPHGAGLSNMIFSRPGTYIIEGVSDFPSTVTCYLFSAYHLGHIYYGLPSKGGFPEKITVDWQDIATILEKVLQRIN